MAESFTTIMIPPPVPSDGKVAKFPSYWRSQIFLTSKTSMLCILVSKMCRRSVLKGLMICLTSSCLERLFNPLMF
jgi:hypothetical protein